MTASKEEGGGDDVKDNVSSGKVGVRHLQVLLLFFGMVIGYSMRVGMSVAVVAMANSSTANPDIVSYGWNPSERSMILSSFFWGYTIMQIPSGYIAGVWSAQKLLVIGIFLCGVFNLLVHFAANWGGIIAVCACRVGMGLSQSCLLPCIHTLLSKWVPPSERARMGTFAYAGGQFGTVIALPICGVLAGSAVGWPSIFYVFGASAVLWSIIFFIFGSDTPARNLKISREERRYIETSLQIANNNSEEKKLPTPWKQIFTSVPMWALIVAHCGQNWGYWTLLTEMPTYLNSVLDFNIEENGGISALPYLVMWILSFPVSWLSDYALRKGVSRAVTRKVCNTIAYWGPAAALIVLGLVPTDKFWAVVILVIAVGLNAGSLCGFQINHIDLSPNYAGTMMSITNCLASVIAIIAPLIVGEIVVDVKSRDQWSIVFYIAAGVSFFSNLIFLIWGKAEIQWWNDPRNINKNVGLILAPI